MINLDLLENLRLDRTSPALNRKRWDLPLQYDSEYLGGFYDSPVRAGPDGPVGIDLHFGSKTGDKKPVSLDLGCTKGVLLPGARHYSYRFHKPAAKRANQLCRLMGLPTLLGEPVVDPVITWQSALPEAKARLFKTAKGFGIVFESDGILLNVDIGCLSPLKGPRYLGVHLFDLERVAKNCPRRERDEILGYIRRPGDLLRGGNLIDPAEFSPTPGGKSRVWNRLIASNLGEFRLEVRPGKLGKVLDEQTLEAALDLALWAEENDDQIRNLVFGDYQRMARLDANRLAENKVPAGLRRKEVRNHLTERALVVEHRGDNKSWTACLRVQPRWRGSDDLILCVTNGRISTVDGKAFKLRDEVLWLEGDDPVKRRPKHEPTPAQQTFAKALRLLPVQISTSQPPRPIPGKVSRLMAEAGAARFLPLGWLEVIMMMPLKLAAFSNADGSIYLSIAVNELFPMQTVDLVSHLGGSRTLTTTNLEMVMPQPDRGAFKFSHPKAGIAGLLKKHLQHLRELKATPLPRQKTLQDFSDSIQQCLRLEGQSPG